MDGLMAIEALSHEALYGALHRYFVSERNLVLDNDMKNRVHHFHSGGEHAHVGDSPAQGECALLHRSRAILSARAPQGDRTVAHSPFAWPLHSTGLFVSHVPVTGAQTRLLSCLYRNP